jgi:hypothetical protein
MAATITYASSRVTISGAYKQFTGTSTATVVTFSAGEAPAGADAGRFILWCAGGTTDTGPWQIRRITAASSTTCTVHNAWVGTPTAGDTFRISSTLDDILSAQPSAGTKTGDSTFRFNGELELTAAAFLGCADQSAEWNDTGSDPMFPMADNTALQLGQLWGGEGSGTETTNGCRWYINQSGTGQNSVYSNVNSRSASGPVVNFYGSLIESRVGSGAAYLFQRMRGPTRFIGSVFDGVMGGRFYHESSEWADCRMSGNNSLVPAWSIGATFTRPIDSIKFFQNLAAFKNFLTFGGTLRNCTFADSNTSVARIEGSVGSVIDFIDCTEFLDAKISDNGSGILNQFRSINLVTTEANGTALSGVVVRVNDAADATQGAVQTSDGSGIVAEILALRRRWTNASPSATFSPFRIRLRKYGYLWASLNASIADPIKQSTALMVDASVTQASGTAAAHTGITLTDHGGSPVSWNSKSWGITVTCDLTVNPSLTVDDVAHYLHWHLAQNASIGGKASGLLWHNLLPMGGTETENGTYGATTKGVRVVTQAGDPMPGVTRMQADDGTYYVPPVTYTLTLTGLVAGSEVRAYTGTDPATAVELTATESSGTTFPINHTGGAVAGFIVVRKSDYKFLKISVSYESASSSLPVSQQPDPWYVNPP